MKVLINGYRSFGNIILATIVFSGGLGFILAGFSSYFQKDLLPLSKSTGIVYVPQGLALTFYGTVGVLVGLFMWLSIFWNVGSGYYELTSESVIISRKLFPGKGRELELRIPREFVKSLQIQVSSKLSAVQTFVVLKNNVRVPLITSDKPLYLIERNLVEVAKFLNTPIETTFK
jgi:hypothetical protein